MKKKLLILVGLFIILVLAFTPARLAELFIPQNAGVVVSGVSGSIWSGKTNQVQYRDWRFSEIDYSLNFLPLITASLSGDASIKGGDLVGDFSFSINDKQSISLYDANLEIEANRFESSLPFPGILLGGTAMTNNLSVNFIGQKPVYIEGKTSWSNANLSMAGSNWPLGHFDIVWQTNQDTGLITGDVSKVRQNQLGIEGKVTLTGEGMFEFRGSVSASIDQNIFAAFSLFSNGPVKDGRLPIKFKKKIF